MGYLFLVICQAIVGSSYPIAKAAVDTIPAWILACVTLGIASAFLMPIASIVEKTKWMKIGADNWLKVGVQSLCACVLYTVFLFFALPHASATVSGIFNGLAPALVFVLAPFIVKEKINGRKIISIIMAIAAVVIISFSSSSSTSGTDVWGIIFLSLSALSVSVFTVFSKKFSMDLSPITMAAGVCFSGFIITLPFCVYQTVAEKFQYKVFFENGNLPATIYYAVFVWAVAYVLWYYGIPKVAATFGGVAQAIVPIASMIASVVFFHETLRIVDMVGLILITISVIVSVFVENQTEQVKTETA